MIGPSDERENPGRVTAGRGRLIVMVSFAEPIWASGHRAASTGRTHDRRRTAIKFCRIPLALQGPSTHARQTVHHCAPLQVESNVLGDYADQRNAPLMDSNLHTCLRLFP